jgi:hypothetical protein
MKKINNNMPRKKKNYKYNRGDQSALFFIDKIIELVKRDVKITSKH